MPERPTQPTPDPRAHLEGQFRSVVQGQARPRRDHRIVYRVSGGPPTRRLERILEISGSGAVSLSVLDEMESRRARKFQSKLPTDEVVRIFGRLLESGLLAEHDAGCGFLPDSVVGSITVTDGTSEATYYFLADEEQRRRQRAELPPSLSMIGPVLERLAGSVSASKGRAGRNG